MIFLFTLCKAYRLQKPDMGYVGGYADISIECVYLRSFLILGNLVNFNLCQECSSGRCLLDMYIVRIVIGMRMSINLVI